MERKMFDTPVLPRLETILAEVKSGDLVVPEFQREFVWEDERRLNLLDSIAAGMPIGSLLVWRTAQRELGIYTEIGGIKLGRPSKSGEKLSYLIDGHQRISTLFGALHIGERSGPAEDKNGVRWPLYYELGAKERPAFRVRPGRGEVPAHWLPLHIVFDGERMYEFTTELREKKMMTQAREAERLANLFRDYIIPIVPLVTEDLSVVTDAFVRINSQGKSMSEAHMLRALAYLKIDMDKYFALVRQRLEPLGWALVEDQVLVNVLKAQLNMDVYSSHVRGVFESLKKDPAPLDRLGDVMVEAVEVLEIIGVRGPGALPYTYQLVTLAALAAQFPGKLGQEKHRKTLEDWFWITTYTEVFAGTTGSRIREIIRSLADALRTGGTPSLQEAGPIKPLVRIRLSTGRTRAFLLFLAKQAKDKDARRRRQEWLGMVDNRTVPPLLPDRISSDLPGSRVIASPEELRTLRLAIEQGAIDEEMADEYVIPEKSLIALRKRDEKKFIEARNAWLLSEEKKFIEGLGLTIDGAE